MGTPFRVLIVEDSEEDTLLIIRELKRGGFDPIYERVETPEAMAAALKNQSWDIVIADYVMPHFSGLDALRLLQKSDLDLPFIIVSGKIGEDIAVAAMKAGAHDYLMKNKLTRLVPAIEQELRETEVIRKLKQSEKEFQETRRSLEAVVETAPSLIVLTDPDGRIVLFNRTCEELTGYKREEVIGKTIPELFLPPEWVPIVQKRFADPYAPEVRAPHENPWVTKSGEERLIEWRCTVLPSPEDGRPRILGTGIDMTDRNRAEEVLRIEKQRFQTLSENAPFGMVMIDRDGAFKYINPKFRELFGYDLDDIPDGKTWFRKAYPDSAYRHDVISAWVDDLRDSCPGEKRQRIFTITCKDGTKKIINFIPVQLETGENLMTFEDITERKRVEKSLQNSEERFRQVAESAGEWIWEVDSNGLYTYVNPVVEKMLGFKPKEIIGKKHFYDLFPPNIREKIKKAAFEVFAKKEPFKNFSNPNLHKNGNLVILETSGTPIIDDKGILLGYRGLDTDITERKRAEEALRRAIENDEIVAEIGRIISSTLNIEEVYERFAEEVQKLISFDRIAVNIINHEEETVAIAYVIGVDVADSRLGDVYPLAGSFTEKVMQARSGLLIQTEDMDEVKTRFPSLMSTFQAGLRSMITVPLISKDWMIGVLHIRSLKPNAYTESDVRLAERVANQIAGAIANAQLFIERKRAEEALRESEERYRSLFDGIPIGLYRTTPAGQFLSANPALAHMLGYPNQESLRALNADDLYMNPQDRKPWQTMIEREGIVWNYEVRLRRPDGTIMWVKDTARVASDASGQVLWYEGSMEDITERKQTEEALRRAEENFRRSLNESPLGVHIVTTEGETVYANRAILDIYGYDSIEELRTTPVKKRYTPESYAEFKIRKEKRQRGEYYPSEYEINIVRKNGEIRDLMVFRKEVLWNGKRQFQTVYQDITDRKRAEEALRESEEKYRTILENIEDGYFEVDLAGNFTFFNNALQKILGYPKEEIMGMNNRQYMDKEGGKKVYQVFNQIYTSGEPAKSFEYGIIRKDGTRRVFEGTISLIRDVKGERIGFRGVARDITEHKQAEEKMRSLEEQLGQSQKMEAIGRLAGGIAHDFNNLLTVIKGYSQLSLMSLKTDDPLEVNIKEILKATERAVGLIRQLLAFSRRQVLEFRVIDLNSLIRDIEKMLHRILGEDIELMTLLAEDLGKVKTDPGQIEQVIMNLAVNARDAMPSGGRLTLETTNAELDEEYAQSHVDVKPGRYVMLSVSDTGVGMTPEILEKVFEPFFTTKEKGKGTGLGLSTVYGIVKQSEGNIWAYSEPGRGTTFTIYLPWVEETLEEREEKGMEEKLPCGGETVLIVEDEEEVRRLTVQILKKHGYQVLEASQGGEALLLCEQYKDQIHLMLTDVVMPGMSGHELAMQLKTSHPEMKVLYMSGYTDNAIVHYGILEKGVNYIQKPFAIDGLAKKVREVLDK